MKTCNRCFDQSEPSSIGAVLFNFVCDQCRRDVNRWEFKDQRVEDFEYQMVQEDTESGVHKIVLDKTDSSWYN